MTYTASCLCAGIAFRLTGELAPLQICHCTQCRKAQGSAFAANLPVAREAFHLDRGAELLAEYESSPGKKRVFCRRCGSPVYSYRDALPGVLRIRAGLIHEPLPGRAAYQAYLAEKANWWPVGDDVPQFAGAATPPAPPVI